MSSGSRSSSFAYDGDGNLASFTDPENRTTTYDYDSVGRMTAVHRPDASSVWFSYDPNGNMTVLTNPISVDHVFGYDGANLNTAYHTPLSGSYAYVYDKDRRLTETYFPSGKLIANVYADGLLIRTQTPEGDVNVTYLCSDLVDTISKGAEAISYGYDGSLVTSETRTGTLAKALSYTYNSDFDVTGFTYAGATVGYAYDNDGLLTGSGPYTIGRNAANGLPESFSGGTLSVSRSFNGYGELSSQDYRVSGQSKTAWSLTRTASGRIFTKSETVDGVTANYEYGYDPFGRLTTVTKNSVVVESYAYDTNGARSSETNTLRGITGRTFTYSDEDHLLTAGSVNYQYDADGFLLTKTDGGDVTDYDYSSRGELLSVTLPENRVIEYVHDPIGRRIAKLVDGVFVEKYLWQGRTRLLAVYDGSDALTMRFEYADGRMPVAMTKAGTTYYLTYDQVGSLRLVTDSAGTVVKQVDYDSFGNIINDTNPSFSVPFGFAGGLYDRDSGLVRFGFRDYDPDTGRWTAKDPIGFAGGDVDLYGYCINDPVNVVDSMGLQVSSPTLSPSTPILHPVFIPGTPENKMFVDSVWDIINGIGKLFSNGSDEEEKANQCPILNETSPGTPPIEPDDEELNLEKIDDRYLK